MIVLSAICRRSGEGPARPTLSFNASRIASHSPASFQRWNWRYTQDHSRTPRAGRATPSRRARSRARRQAPAVVVDRAALRGPYRAQERLEERPVRVRHRTPRHRRLPARKARDRGPAGGGTLPSTRSRGKAGPSGRSVSRGPTARAAGAAVVSALEGRGGRHGDADGSAGGACEGRDPRGVPWAARGPGGRRVLGRGGGARAAAGLPRRGVDP